MALAASVSTESFAAPNAEAPRAKNIIFMVPDGLGMSYVTATRIFANDPDGDSLYFETLPQIGCQRTHSANGTVTDSAAASALAAGEKFNNGETSCSVGRWLKISRSTSCWAAATAAIPATTARSMDP